jgi:hypothetical protein
MIFVDLNALSEELQKLLGLKDNRTMSKDLELQIVN